MQIVAKPLQAFISFMTETAFYHQSVSVIIVYAQWYGLQLEHHEQLLTQLDAALKRHPDFERAFIDFESQKVCYLPLGTFLLKPIQRLIHYQQLLESMFYLPVYNYYRL